MKMHFHREISELNTYIAKLGGLVEDAIGKSLTSLRHGDKSLAKDVRNGDDSIDSLEVEIEECCLKILALYQPVAKDLRFIVAILKVNNELEHMGDLAQSIAQKAKTITQLHVAQSKMEIFKMGERVQRMVGMSLDALLKEDAEKAREVIRMDNDVDRMHHNHHRIIAELLEDRNRDFNIQELGLLSVSRSLERIADMATSIAEDVIYFLEARIVRHNRDVKPT